MGSCGLCGGDLGAAGGRRLAGLDLCTSCDRGAFGPGIADRGMRFQDLMWQHRVYENTKYKGHEVIGAVPHDLGIQASFAPERWRDRLGKLVGRREVQVGDPLFDRHVFIRTDTPDATAAALASEGLRQAILDFEMVMAQGHESLRVEGNVVRYGLQMPYTHATGADLRRQLAVVLHHLERHAVDRGLSREDALIRFPLLRRFGGHKVHGHIIRKQAVRWITLRDTTVDDLTPLLGFLGHRGWASAQRLRLESVRFTPRALEALMEAEIRLSVVLDGTPGLSAGDLEALCAAQHRIEVVA